MQSTVSTSSCRVLLDSTYARKLGWWNCRKLSSRGPRRPTSSTRSKWRVTLGHYCKPSCRKSSVSLCSEHHAESCSRLRKTAPPEYPHPRDLLAANPYTPPAALAQSIMNASPTLSSLVVVREWLHDSAPLPATPGATNGYWRFTRNAVLQGKRTGRVAGGVVSELDPDAVNRGSEEGKSLAPDDTVSWFVFGLLL